jgi:prephenate dehydrogenase
MPTARRALIAGLGLIGGSIGIALRRAGWRVAYDDPNVSLEQARAAGAADEAGGDAGIIILAMPVDAAVEALGTRHSTLVTSVCSVMGPLRKAADEHHLSFVAGHPLAGSEQRGLAAARGDLFEGKSWFVDRDEPMVAGIIEACGARADRVDADEHDRAVALTSHLPQVLSTALACLSEQVAASSEQDLLRFAGSGLQTFLRLAGSDASVWGPIIAANRGNISEVFEQFIAVARRILEGDPRAFDDAQRLWTELQRR